MTVTVLWFAALKDLFGPEEALDLPDSVGTVGHLEAYLEQSRPELGGRLATCRFAVNEEFVSQEEPLLPNAVVAVIPPVSGG